jgi:hypothetical protein
MCMYYAVDELRRWRESRDQKICIPILRDKLFTLSCTTAIICRLRVPPHRVFILAYAKSMLQARQLVSAFIIDLQPHGCAVYYIHQASGQPSSNAADQSHFVPRAGSWPESLILTNLSSSGLFVG